MVKKLKPYHMKYNPTLLTYSAVKACKTDIIWMAIDENGISCSEWKKTIPWTQIDRCTIDEIFVRNRISPALIPPGLAVLSIILHGRI